MATLEESLKGKNINCEIKINEATRKIHLSSNNSNKILNAIRIINSSVTEQKTIHVNSKFELNEESRVAFGFNFSNCIFQESVHFSHLIIKSQDISMSDCEFKSDLSIDECFFDVNVRFHRTIFHQPCSFQNTSFEQLVDFYFAEFKKFQCFHLTDFNKTAIFSNTTFHKSIQFLHNKVNTNSYVSFESATFHEGIDISRANFLCNLKFWGITFPNLDFKFISRVELYQSDIPGEAHVGNRVTALYRVRESLRIIKQSFRKEQNNVSAQEFHKLEMIALKYEQDIQKGKWTEKTLLLLNSVSNQHGTDWGRGLVFTLAVTALFYLINILLISNSLYFDFSPEGFGNVLKYYVQLLNITNWDYQPFGVSNEPWAGPILYVSRIFISYGYYQLIQAFRKHSKN